MSDVLSLETTRSIRELLLRRVRGIIRDCEEGTLNDENLKDSIAFRLDCLRRSFVRYEEYLSGIGLGDLLPLVSEATAIVSDIDQLTLNEPPKIFTGGRGRPRYDVSKGHLEYLVGLGFKVPLISNLVGTSTRTIERRLSEYRLSCHARYSKVSDADLDSIVDNVFKDFPNAGHHRMTGLLRARGLFLQRERIRQSMRRVSPEGIFLRSLELFTIERRHYNVKGPLALWHIDGNHKLIR